MATIRKEVRVPASPDSAWEAFTDYGAVHTRLAQGFVTGTVMEEGARVVTFANGMTARELLVTMDHDARRLVYAIVGGRMSHHNASFQVFPDGAGSRIVWTADLLPNELAETIGAMMEAGCAAMARTLASQAA